MENGTKTRNWIESVEALLDALLPADSLQVETIQQQQKRQQMVQRHEGAQTSPPFEKDKIIEAIKKLKFRKAPGPDGIQSEILLELREEMMDDLCLLYNECLRTGIYPTIWKRGELVIIQKSGDRDPEEPKYCRSICLLDNLGKILERLICKRIQELRDVAGMNPNQFGFRSGKSTEDAINYLVRAAEGRALDTFSPYLWTCLGHSTISVALFICGTKETQLST